MTQTVFSKDAAETIRELTLAGFKTRYIHRVLTDQGYSYTKKQVMHRITYVRHQAGLTRPAYMRGAKLPRDHGYHAVDDYVPSHERRARFDPESHREARHYKGTFDL